VGVGQDLGACAPPPSLKVEPPLLLLIILNVCDEAKALFNRASTFLTCEIKGTIWSLASCFSFWEQSENFTKKVLLSKHLQYCYNEFYIEGARTAWKLNWLNVHETLAKH